MAQWKALQKRNDIKISVIFKDANDISEFPYAQKINYIISKFLLEEEEFNNTILSSDNPKNVETDKITLVVIRLL